MSCERHRDEMLLHLGQRDLPDDLRAHLDSCAECRREWEMLNAAAHHLGDDALFQLDSAAQAEFVQKIEQRIGVTTLTDIRPRVWIRYAAGVAAIFVLGIVALLSTLNLSQSIGTSPSTSADPADSVVYSLTDAAYDLGTTDDDLAYGDVGVLLNDFVSQSGWPESDSLLGGISEDEMKYLQENLKVGDLL